jgi:hypothetical protein
MMTFTSCSNAEAGLVSPIIGRFIRLGVFALIAELE